MIIKRINYFVDCLQLIMLSASANKLSSLKDRAHEYANLIMEELDPENLGYIEVLFKLYFYSHIILITLYADGCNLIIYYIFFKIIS